ncbi:EAL domain-containing protein [Paraburkholderia kururiensis]|uniref:EAL domain-containing protein n=1 Tax=Paraburkholderia kururiensis TaxID=984307 RepID=A0ABZ0WLA3_9BURK|nr:EAL domain-containing protein [Paraburkholderia kururiensis]WQD78147.1 EAL domain-containing protein [Paraburkholderia kururiensis]
MVDAMRRVRFDAVVLYPDQSGGLCFECLLHLSESLARVPVWLAGDAASPLMKCAAIAADSAGLAVRLHRVGHGGAAHGNSQTIDIGRQPVREPFDREKQLDERTVREAVERGHIVPHFQPIIDSRSGSVHSLELLARWPDAPGSIGPDVFMPIITRLNLEGSLIETMLRGAHAPNVFAMVSAGASLSINVSAGLILSEAFLHRLSNTLGKYRPSNIIIEITESDAIDDCDFSKLVSRTAILHANGYRVSIDDFGRGHSSLLRLASLPVSEVKIDRFLVAQAREFGDAQHIIKLCADLARRLGMRSVLEGIETERDLDLARMVAVDAVQGWHISRPVAAGQLASAIHMPLAGESL